MDKHNIKSRVNYRRVLEEKHDKAEEQTNVMKGKKNLIRIK
jgi:hypothetical protein